MNKIFWVSFIFLIFALPVFAITEQERQSLIYQIGRQISELQLKIQQQSLAQNQVAGIWCYDFAQNLYLGNYGIEVFNLKTALNKEGLLDQSFVNMNFDQSTYNAVMAFQEKYKKDILVLAGLKKGTGFVGTATRAKLNKIFSCSQLSGCVPAWKCSDWSLCKNNKQIRKCSDIQNCGILLGKPQEEQQCLITSVKILGNNTEKKVTINYGQSVEISWVGLNVISCSASGNWTGSKNFSGTEIYSNLNSSKIFNISCKDMSGKIVSDSLQVDVVIPKIEIKADKKDGQLSIYFGQSADLSWQADGVQNCWAFGDWLGDKPLKGSESTGYLTNIKKYNFGLSCSSGKGVISDNVYIDVLAPSLNLTANNSDGVLEIDANKSVSLKWTSSGISSCSGLGDWQGSKKVIGTESMGKISTQKFYILECIDFLGNKINDSILVKIK